jgi:pimeloyl-ACP methyl ester carboxylesterase
VKSPSLVRSLILYDPNTASVLSADSAEGKSAREDRARIFGPSIAASKAGDSGRAMRLLVEGLFALEPGGFDRQPQTSQTMWLENARITPLLFAAAPPTTTCDMLHKFTKPMLVIGGEKSPLSFTLVDEAIVRCVPGAQRVVLPGVGHDGPGRDPARFSAAVLEFLSKH